MSAGPEKVHDGTGGRIGGRYGRQAYGFAMPAIVIVLVLTYVPFLYTTAVSFTRYGGIGVPEWVGWDNYLRMLGDPFFVSSATNTLLWVAGTIVVPVALGLGLAVLTYNSRWGALLRLPFILPYAISGVAVGIVWGFILQGDGALTEALARVGLPDEIRWLSTAPRNTVMMILASAWQATGVNALLFVVGLQSIPKEPLEAAQVDGANGWRLFGSILWPMLRPITTVVVGLAIVGSLKTFDVVWVMTQGGPGRSSETLAITMYKETFVAGAYGVGSAIAVVLTAVTMLASITYIRRQMLPKHEF